MQEFYIADRDNKLINVKPQNGNEISKFNADYCIAQSYMQIIEITTFFWGENSEKGRYLILVGFGRACAPVRCAHPSFLGSLTRTKGRCAPPPVLRSSAASYSSAKIQYSNNHFMFGIRTRDACVKGFPVKKNDSL